MKHGRLAGALAGAGALLVTTGSVLAADPPPMFVAPMAGPQAAIQFDTTIVNDWDFDPFDATDFDWETDVLVDFQRPEGWGFQFLGIADVYDGGFNYDLGVRTYRSFGTTTLGFYAAVEGEFCCGLDDINVGMDVAFQHGNLMIGNRTYANFDLAFDDINTYTAIAFAVSDIITVGGGVFFDFPSPDFEFDAWIQADLGAFKPYAYAFFDPTLDYFGFGVDYERPLGTGPFSFIANAEIEYDGDLDVDIIFGIRFNQGQVNAPWWWKPLGINGIDTNSL